MIDVLTVNRLVLIIYFKMSIILVNTVTTSWRNELLILLNFLALVVLALLHDVYLLILVG